MTTESSIDSGVKVRQFNKTLIAVFDFRKRCGRQPLDAEILHCKRSDDGSIDNGASNSALAVIPRARHLAEKTAGERVSGSGGIEDLLQRVRWSGKDRGIRKLQHAVLASL